MSDVSIRRVGRAGRITLTRPRALNALGYQMCRTIDRALIDWAHDPAVALVVLDAEGERAFCAGGDIAEVYASGRAGDPGYARRFWHDEYLMNARIAGYPKPVASFLQGFTMGGGVGLGCHGSHRVVGETSRLAMPECAIGLIPDVGGSHLLARAPGRLGDYLGTTGTRMGPADAILAGFADAFVPQAAWPGLITGLERTGEVGLIAAAAEPPPAGCLADHLDAIGRHFASGDLATIEAGLEGVATGFAAETREALSRASPLAAACTLEALRRLRASDGGIQAALAQEYRFTWRALPQSDFLEGIRAAIIDKDRRPVWTWDRHRTTPDKVRAMLASLGPDEIVFDPLPGAAG